MSIEMNPVGWFEIPATDLARAKSFYEHVFGITLQEHTLGELRMAWFPMNEGAIGATGSLVQGAGREPSDGGVLIYFTAPDLEASLARASEQGGEVITGRTDIGEYGFIGIIRDTEGNVIGLHSRE